ncbi:MAG TPA: hypothetical protein VJR06_02330 [Nitrososphaerales archaeon]|nr:hypothetical protein [Nitrososphaerales archaeon]
MTRRPENSGQEVCQSCGQDIAWDTDVIAVRYGKIRWTINHTAVSKERVDYFHDNGKCEVGIRTKPPSCDCDHGTLYFDKASGPEQALVDLCTSLACGCKNDKGERKAQAQMRGLKEDVEAGLVSADEDRAEMLAARGGET